MFLDRILTKTATANGTGNITWTTAVAQYALPPTGVNTTVDYTILDANGTDWESGTTTLIESGGIYTLTRGGSQTVNSSSNSGSAVSLTNSTTHTCFLSVSGTTLNQVRPKTASVTVTTSDVTSAVNTHYQLTVSGLTNDRYLILPSGASAGDVISWELMSDAPANYELILKGDTGVTVTLRNESVTASEVTRYFIEGETGKAVFDGSEWRINRANDGRIDEQQFTFSASASATFRVVEPSSVYELFLQDIHVSSATAVKVSIRVSTDGGSTFHSSNYYIRGEYATSSAVSKYSENAVTFGVVLPFMGSASTGGCASIRFPGLSNPSGGLYSSEAVLDAIATEPVWGISLYGLLSGVSSAVTHVMVFAESGDISSGRAIFRRVG